VHFLNASLNLMIEAFFIFVSMKIIENFSLQNLNTFGISAKARFFAQFSDYQQITDLLKQFKNQKQLILGGGSNLLLTNDFEGIVLKNEIKGIELNRADEDFVYVRVGAGENWHQFVLTCIENDWAGVENLSLIPGTVGAAPMQNIGAYGVEIQSVIESVEALDKSSYSIRIFSNADCKFGYRESVFKNECKDQYIITHVNFRLFKRPQFNISYGAIQQTLTEMGKQDLSIKTISEAVCKIRSSKLPNPAEIGNAGSFFKNPEIPISQFEKMKSLYPNLVSYPVNEEIIKIPAAWLIEQAGWKGHRRGQIGVHTQQALVLVNYGGGNGLEIKQLANDIQASVQEKFGILLKPEVNFI
jgi:UDP-N-acetylmuramate dehydrogenase